MQNLSGRKLGNYELRERLGRGGMAEVYKAYQASMDRFVAVKVMLGHLADDDSFIERFKREAQAVGRLRHPHIIDIFDFGIEEDVYYMAMEYLTDGNLKEYIDKNEKLPLEASLKMARDLADALAYAHNAGMIHRDLKPANVMFVDKAKLNVVLTDFGIARILNATGLTGTGMSVGTPSYMSPEAGSGEDTDERADIYALGIIMYEMLVGKVPYNADTPLAVIMKHISAPLPTRAEYGEFIPEPVERVMLKCLAKDPNDRYANASDLRDALDEVLQQAPNLAKTNTVQSKQADTKVASSNKANALADTLPDAPTSAVAWQDTEAIPASSQTNSLMTYGIVGIIAIIVIAGLFYFINPFAAPVDEATEEAQTLAMTDTSVPDESQATAVPTDAPEPTAAMNPEPEILQPITPPDPINLHLLSGDINPDDARNIEFETEQLLIQNRLEDAENVVNEAIAEGEPNIDELASKTRIAIALGDQALALETANMMLELDPNNPNAHINMLDALYIILPDIDRETATMLLEEGQALDTQNIAFIWRRIPLADDPAEQMELFNEAEASGARGWRFVLFAGKFLMQQGAYQRAIPYLEAALELPDEIFHQQGRIEQQVQYANSQLSYMAYFPDYPLTLGGVMPPHPANLTIFSNINEILNDADEMVFDGEWEAALEWVTSILEEDPDNPEALFARSQLYAYNWDEENLSGQDAQHLINLDPNNVWGYVALADSWLAYPTVDEEGSIEQALTAIQQAYEIDPENPHVFWRLAWIGDWELAGERLFMAEELAASGFRYLYVMGEYLYVVGDYQRAIPYLEAFHRYTPQDTYENGEAFWFLMQSLMLTGNPHIAFDYMTQSSIAANAADHETFGLLAYIAFQASQFDEAQEWADTALAFSSDAYAARYVLGQLAYWRDGDADAAVEQLESIAEEDGFFRFIMFDTVTDPALESARIMMDAQRYEDAVDYYSIAIETTQYLPFLYEERANAYLELDEIEAARADLQQAFELETDAELRAYYRQRIVELGPASDD